MLTYPLIRTGAESLTGSEYMTIGVDDFGDVADYGIDATRAALEVLYPTPAQGRTVGLEPPIIQEHEPEPGIYCVKVADVDTTFDGIVAGRIITINRDAGAEFFGEEAGDDPAGVFEECPYPRVADVSYQVCADFCRYPIEFVPAGGAVRVKRWRDSVGRESTPDAVAIDGSGLVMTLTEDTFHGTDPNGGAWAAHATIGRRVVVWKNVPVTFGEDAVFHGVALSDGTDVTVEIDHAFGQTSPSTTASDYSIVVLGLIVIPVDALGATPGFWMLSTVENGDVTPTVGSDAFAYRPEDLLAEITETNTALDTLDDRVSIEELETELAGLSRPGILFADEADYRAWEPTVVDEGTQILLTFPLFADGEWVRVNGKTATSWAASLGAGVNGFAGRTIRFPKATGSATFTVYLSVGANGPENLAGVSTIDPLPGLVAFVFDYTSGAGSITAKPVDLYPHRGTHPGNASGVGNVDNGTEHSLGDVVLYDPAREGDYTSADRASRSLLRSDESAAPVTYRKQHTILSHHRQDAASTDRGNSGLYALDVVTDWDNENRIFRFFSPGGTSQVSGAERVYAELGASIALEAREASSGGGGRAALAIVESVANPEQLFDLDDENGNTSEATSGGQRWSLEIGEGVDLRLRGNGKLVVRGVPLWPNGFSPGGIWTWDTTNGYWTDGAVAGSLYIPIPPPSVDQRTGTTVEAKISRVVVYGDNSGGTGAQDLVAVLVRHTPVSGNLAAAVEISAPETWFMPELGERTVDVDGSTVDAFPVGEAAGVDSTVYLKITGAKTGTPSTGLVYYVKVYYRVYTLCA